MNPNISVVTNSLTIILQCPWLRNDLKNLEYSLSTPLPHDVNERSDYNYSPGKIFEEICQSNGMQSDLLSLGAVLHLLVI
jgi:hypothetical protein